VKRRHGRGQEQQETIDLTTKKLNGSAGPERTTFYVSVHFSVVHVLTTRRNDELCSYTLSKYAHAYILQVKSAFRLNLLNTVAIAGLQVSSTCGKTSFLFHLIIRFDIVQEIKQRNQQNSFWKSSEQCQFT